MNFRGLILLNLLLNMVGFHSVAFAAAKSPLETRGETRVETSGETRGAASSVAVTAVTSVATFKDGGTPSGTHNWIIKKDRWSPGDEKNYSEFIVALGSSGCTSVDRCMKSPSNPYRSTDPAGITWRSDCAEFPYFLRAYFAWKNSLPFSYVSGVKPVGASHDDRYSPDGNNPTQRHDIVAKEKGVFPSGPKAINNMLNEMNSAMFRIDPRYDSASLFSDFYSVPIDPRSIHPGTMIYDPAGHVVTIYKIETDGRLLYFDAHPDNSVSHSVYGEKFVRSRPGQGAGFKNWRPLILEGAQVTAEGMVGGHVRATANKDLSDYSIEQYFGNRPSPDGKWSKGVFVLPNHSAPLEYYDYVRTKMATGDLRYEPVEEMRNMMASVCQDFQDRAVAVQNAADKGIDRSEHPARLPQNIYGTDGEWETFSSPSRDARLKTSLQELLTSTQKYLGMYAQHDPRILYQGTDLVGDLRKAYAVSAAACSVSYQNSAQVAVAISYDALVHRVYAFSFDPYHCPELRWGASGSELQTCQDGAEKLAWYHGEQRLRNQLERAYSTKMGFSLQDLLNGVPGSGQDQAPTLDLGAYLNGL